MAGGKLTPRQKMINMMYLVLTAMLALNVSKDILKALQKLDENMTKNVATVETGNANLYLMLSSAAAEKPRAREWNQKALELQPQANNLVEFIEELKVRLINETGGREEDGSIKGADNRDVPTRLLVSSKAAGGEGLAADLKQQIESYKQWLLSNAGDDQDMIADINQTFDLSDRKEEGEDTKRSWEEATFAELPLAGIIPFLTDIQGSVRRTESNMLELFALNIDKSTIKFTSARPVVQASSTYIQTGDKYEAQVFLAAFNDNQDPIFTLDGTPVDGELIEGGVASFSFNASGVGSVSKEGTIQLPGSDDVYAFTLDYVVAPSSVVISPTAMNVLYRQVKNPLAVSVPGVEPENLIVTGPGIRPTGSGTFEADVTSVSGQEVTINVAVKEADGSTRQAGSQKFRIKGLPPAQGMIFGRNTSGPYTASAISAATVEAAYQDFPFDLNLNVRSFQLVVPGEAPFNISGNKMTAAAKSALSAARPGSTIIIRDIRATIVGSGEQVRNVGQLSLDLN